MTQSPEAALAVLRDPETVRYISRFGGRCRECADTDGICPKSRLPCEDQDTPIKFVLDALAYGIENGFLAALRAKPAGDVEQNPLWPFAIHAPIFKGDADRDVADLAGHSLLVSDFRRAAAALAQLPADQFGIETLCSLVFLAGHSEGWTGNQLRRDAQHVDAEKGWRLYVQNGALAKAMQRASSPPTQAIDIGSTMPDPFYKTGEDIR